MNGMTAEISNRISHHSARDTHNAVAKAAIPPMQSRIGDDRGTRRLRLWGAGLALCLPLLTASMAAAQSQSSPGKASEGNESTRSGGSPGDLGSSGTSQDAADPADHSPAKTVRRLTIEAVVAPSIPAEALRPGQLVDVILIGQNRDGAVSAGKPTRIAHHVRLIQVEPQDATSLTRRITVSLPQDQAKALTQAQDRGALHLVLADEKEATRRALPPLTEMLATALKNNPDIRVAEAQLQEAEAELSRTRLEVVQKVMTLQNAWQIQQRLIAQAADEVGRRQEEVEHIKSLAQEAVAPQSTVLQAISSLKQAETELLQAEAELAQLEASIPYLLGEQAALAQITQRNQANMAMGFGAMMSPAGGTGMMMYPDGDRSMEMMGGGISRKQGGTNRAESPDVGQAAKRVKTPGYPGAGGMAAGMGMMGEGMPGSSMAPAQSKIRQMLTDGGSADAKAISNRIRRALGSPTELEFYETPLPEALDFLRELHGINFFIDAAAFEGQSPLGGSSLKPDQVKLTLDLRDVPLGAALQAIEDTQGSIRFVVRDYGILVTRKGFEPPNAVSARDFWKGRSEGYGMGGVMGGYDAMMMDESMMGYDGTMPGGLPGARGLPTKGGLPGGGQPPAEKKR